MGRWTNWRLIADKKYWYDDELDWDGPVCYELAIAGPRGGDLRIVYVGESSNEKYRIASYARSGSHLSEIIDWHLKEGWYLYYRGYTCNLKREAMEMQNKILADYKYDWNIQLNPED